MNPYISIEEQLERETQVQATVTETDLLAQCGLSAEEIVALLWLRRLVSWRLRLSQHRVVD